MNNLGADVYIYHKNKKIFYLPINTTKTFDFEIDLEWFKDLKYKENKKYCRKKPFDDFISYSILNRTYNK